MQAWQFKDCDEHAQIIATGDEEHDERVTGWSARHPEQLTNAYTATLTRASATENGDIELVFNTEIAGSGSLTIASSWINSIAQELAPDYHGDELCSEIASTIWVTLLERSIGICPHVADGVRIAS